MEKDDFLRKIADRLLECITEHPEGGIWNVWHIEAGCRLFTAYVTLDVDYFPEEGVTFLGETERWLNPVLRKVTQLEVYETDWLYDDVEGWDVQGNSGRIKDIINRAIKTGGV